MEISHSEIMIEDGLKNSCILLSFLSSVHLLNASSICSQHELFIYVYNQLNSTCSLKRLNVRCWPNLLHCWAELSNQNEKKILLSSSSPQIIACTFSILKVHSFFLSLFCSNFCRLCSVLIKRNYRSFSTFSSSSTLINDIWKVLSSLFGSFKVISILSVWWFSSWESEATEEIRVENKMSKHIKLIFSSSLFFFPCYPNVRTIHEFQRRRTSPSFEQITFGTTNKQPIHCLTHKIVSYPSNLDLTRPETLGLFATRHFHLNYNDDDDDNVDKQEEDGAKRQVSIASWHSLPHHISKRFYKQLQLSAEIVKNISNEDNVHNDANDPAEHSYKVIEKLLPENFDIEKYEHKRIMFEEILRKTKDPIVLYLHGNTGTRANGHRIELYRILQRLGYHVIAMDYRGFADSSDISPTEPGCVSDALSMYRYIKNITNNPLFVYGHSLGKTEWKRCFFC